jgi:translation elongation factor EF-1alpha
MEKNGLEGMVPSSVTLWHYLPLEIWYQIFEYLKASRYIGLIGTLSKHFQGVMLDYFTHNVSWMGKNLNIAVIGAPDVGKSTMLTHLLLQSGQRGVERSFEHFVKTHPDLKPESKYNSFINNDFGHTTFTKHVNSLYVSTNLHSLTFLDTPGCSRRLLSAYRVCSQVNTAILMFSKAKDGKFDWLVNGVTAILTSLTHSHFVIAINYKPEEFTQAVFEEDKKLIGTKLVRSVPDKLLPNIKLIPINALSGYNIFSPHVGIESYNAWYNGPTLFRAVHSIWEKLEYNDERVPMPFVMPLIRSYKMNRGSYGIHTGIVTSGQLKPEMELMVMTPRFPAGVKLVVNRIETKNKQLQEANPWDIIGIEFKKVPLSKHSDVYTNADLYYQVKNICRFGALIVEKNRAPKQVKSFVAALAFPTAKTGQMREGRVYWAVYICGYLGIKIEKIIEIRDKTKNQVTRTSMSQGDSALVLCVPQSPMYMFGMKQGKTTKNVNKKNAVEAILFIAQQRIQAVGRIDTITFVE